MLTATFKSRYDVVYLATYVLYIGATSKIRQVPSKYPVQANHLRLVESNMAGTADVDVTIYADQKLRPETLELVCVGNPW